MQNPLATALLGDQTRFRGPARSAYYRWFTDPDERRLYPEADHGHQSRVQAASLRVALTAAGTDTTAATIVEHLLRRSPEFAGV